MLSHEDNTRLTQTGPGTPGGDLLRCYWQPVGLSVELPEGGAPLPVKILGEDLVLFRDDQGLLGLLGLHCSHRGTDLSYGRIEDGGLRCLYHGWLYDVEGNCLEMPGEPAGSDFCGKIRHTSYACHEVSGLILAYLGPGEPPLLPDYEVYRAPADHQHVFKYLEDCNYLQASEGNLDPAHTSFVHQMFQREEDETGHRIPVSGSGSGLVELYGQDAAPSLDVEETDFGLRIYAVRKIGSQRRLVRITNFIMPNLSISPAGTGDDGYSIIWHVPIDDEHSWKYQINYRRSAPIEDSEALRLKTSGELTPDYRRIRNRSNRYLQNRDEMNHETYAGMGPSFGVHDAVAIETSGAIQDRTKEHLGTTDKAIIQARRMMARAIERLHAGQDPPHVIRDPSDNDMAPLVVISKVIGTDSDEWRNVWKARDDAGRIATNET